MKRTKSTYLALIVLLSPMAANADIITFDCTVNAGTCVTALTGLDVDGTLYDVDFLVYGSYNDIYTTAPTFLGDQAGADAAASAIMSLLSGSGLDGVLSNSDGFDFFIVPYKLHGEGDLYPGEVDVVHSFESLGSWFGPSDCANGCLSSTFDHSNFLPVDSYAWTVFTPAAVPEPGTLALFGIGLFGMGLARRRRKV